MYRVSRSEVAVSLMIVLCGLALLVGLAVAIGVDNQARDAAWRRIAVARREQQERLRGCLASPRCPRCPIDRYFGKW